jgi:hypothetical protein
MANDDIRHSASRERLWNAITERKFFTYAELTEATGLAERTIQGIVRAWETEERVYFTGEKSGKRKIFGVTKEAEAPVTPRNEPGALGRQNSGANMWRAMRGLKTFSPLDVSAHATTAKIAVSEQDARKFCGVLVKTGYLKVRQKAIPGKRPPIYQLVGDTGPNPPVVKRVQVVIDGNNGSIHNVDEVTA